MTQLLHPNIIHFYGICEKTTACEQTGQLENRMYMVTGLATGGSLEGRIEKAIHMKKLMSTAARTPDMQMPFDGLQMVQWAVEIAAGMAYIHGRDFIHRDIKPQNVLLDGVDKALICDLGTTKSMAPGSQQQYGKEADEFEETNPEDPPGMTHGKGTPLYMAPEQHLKGQYTNAVDVWAYGVTLVRLFSLDHPFDGNPSMRDLMLYVSTDKLRPKQLLARDLPHPGLKEVLEGCLEYRAQERWTFAQIELRLSKILKEMKDVTRRSAELRLFLDSHDLSECLDQFLADGIECKEDLVHVTVEDLMAMGVAKFNARKTVAAFADIEPEEKTRLIRVCPSCGKSEGIQGAAKFCGLCGAKALCGTI